MDERQEEKVVDDLTVSGFDRVANRPIQVEIIRNPTEADYARLRDAVMREHPRSLEPKKRVICDSDLNEYIWRADLATHAAVSAVIRKRYNVAIYGQCPDIFVHHFFFRSRKKGLMGDE